MLYNLSYYFILFFIYSFIGYICEVISVSRLEKRLELSRGYLIGPYLPIFGFGALLITFFLDQYRYHYVTLFIMGIFICCFLEYMTSYLLETIFKLRWWDYSNKKFNINGRVCLETGILFGLGSVFIINFLNPFFFSILDNISKSVIVVLGIILGIIIFIDFIISTYAIIHLNIDTRQFSHRDATGEIRHMILESIKKRNYFYHRIFKAFPLIEREGHLKRFYELLMKYKKGDINEK